MNGHSRNDLGASWVNLQVLVLLQSQEALYHLRILAKASLGLLRAFHPFVPATCTDFLLLLPHVLDLVLAASVVQTWPFNPTIPGKFSSRGGRTWAITTSRGLGLNQSSELNFPYFLEKRGLNSERKRGIYMKPS